MSAVQSARAVALPGEIWLLVSQELTSRRDFLSLFNLAQVNRSMAELALPLLYSIHEESPASTGDTAILGPKKWAVLWRSILTSSLRGAMYPYCRWIKSLSLGNLESLLEDLAREQYKEMRMWFFSAPLESFHILVSGTRRTRPRLDLDRIIFAAADQIADSIKKAATEQDKKVGLISLEGYHLPSARLPGWVSKLSLLRSLTVRDGSVLNADVSEAIRKNCPYFKELVCHYCNAPDVDDDMAGFLAGLTPNSLEHFTVMSSNRIGPKTYQSLTGHALSLKELSLYVEDIAVGEVPLLSTCTNLVGLTIDVSSRVNAAWDHTHNQEVREVASWLQECKFLKRLSVLNLPGTHHILSEVLKVPSIQLTDLEITMPATHQDTSAFSSALASQTHLKTFIWRCSDGWFGGPDFIHAICQLPKLRKLDLVTQMLRVGDFHRLVSTMADVQEFSFDIDSDEPVGDDCVLALANLHQLKTLNINATTAFSYEGLLALFGNLGVDPPQSHQGLSIHVMRQAGTEKFTQAQIKRLSGVVEKQFGGKLEITYDRDPGELSESDFSD